MNRLCASEPAPAGLRSSLGCVERGPIVREQFSEPIHGMYSNAREHIAEPGERLDAATFAASDEAHQHGRRLAAFVAAEERPVAAADGDVAIGALGGAVVNLQ